MGGREEPPDGVPEGAPGGDDEFRSVVFDESFVRAARIQELSASERLSAAERGVRTRSRSRSARPSASLPRQAFALMLLIAMAFAAAVYMGIRHPYREPPVAKSRLTMSIVPLAPAATVTAAPGTRKRGSAAGSGDDPFAALEKAAGSTFYDGSVGLLPPPATATRHFSVEQVTRALAAVQQYLVASSLDSKVLVEGSTGAVRDQLAPGQRAQFDDSVGNPRDDLHHAATGWLVRFDPAQVTLGVSKVKVSGGMTVEESDDDTLEVVTDHTFVYALQAAPRDGTQAAARAAASTAPASTAPASTAATTASPGTASPGTASTGTASPGTASTGTASPGSASPSDDTGTDFDPEQLSVPGAPVTLFAVRRELRFQFDRADIDASQLQLVDSVVQAGPMACDAHAERYLRPILAGQATGTGEPQTSGSPSADGRQGTAPLGVDPLDRLHRPAWQLCGVLSGPMAGLPAR
ncbi:SCO2583 family membrane protein [Peterkaempfera griseoplana]|uniref:SCO2583 family membrane protein n=1 Tax=Peterkaempfera griseoplana TaxID=66896 RepID=UPI0006E1EBF4|nr:hypothetical protein [Peterkaempfera griseoplana]